MNKKLLTKLDQHTLTAQGLLIKRFKLFDFAKSAIKYYSKYNSEKFTDYDFSQFRKKFKLVSFKQDKEIKGISYKEIIQVGHNFIENELSDSIFVLNMSTFEHWILTILRLKFLENPGDAFQGSEKTISVHTILSVNDLDELWERVIDEHLFRKPYEGIKQMLNYFLKKFNIDKSKITHFIVDKINENSLCRNLIVHNQKRVSEIYVNSCGKFAKFKNGEYVKIAEDVLFEQGDNLLRFMQDFRKSLKV